MHENTPSIEGREQRQIKVSESESEHEQRSYKPHIKGSIERWFLQVNRSKGLFSPRAIVAEQLKQDEKHERSPSFIEYKDAPIW